MRIASSIPVTNVLLNFIQSFLHFYYWFLSRRALATPLPAALGEHLRPVPGVTGAPPVGFC